MTMARHRRRQRGQALAETGLVIGLLVLMTLGIIEFGYVFFALNMVTNAARDGARAAAALQNRGTSGQIANTSSIPPLVRAQLNGIVTTDGNGACNGCGAGVCVDQCTSTAGGAITCGAIPSPCQPLNATDIPVVRVTVAGHIPYLFGLLSSNAAGFNYCRSSTFRDEGRGCSN